ncbi:MAG: zf-HC2 domain-containing protein [Spirochaetales bacterium]|nr:zf-HC2 domain-containing protein [Spirochaetales bacterium]
MCPDGELLSAYLDGEVEAPWAGRIQEHLKTCSACRGRLEELRRVRELLRGDREPEYQEAFERTRAELLSRVWRSYRRGRSFWRTRVAVPLPAAAAALVLVLGLGVFLVVATVRPNLPWMTIRRGPAGTTEVQVAAPIKDLESLLRSLDDQRANQAITITLPEDSTFLLMGEPRMLRAADYHQADRQTGAR